jgi:hypothetical protein
VKLTEKEWLTKKDLVSIGKAAIHLARRLPAEKQAERWFLPVIYGYAAGRFGHKFVRERLVSSGRIDFRFTGSSPTVFEVAVRDPNHQIQAYGPGNRTELHKLCRETSAFSRTLLLIDLSGEAAIPEKNLRKSYAAVTGPRGGGFRESVRVIYVHPKETYDFLWRPWTH